MGVVVVEGDRVGYEVMRDGDGREEEREWEREIACSGWLGNLVA